MKNQWTTLAGELLVGLEEGAGSKASQIQSALRHAITTGVIGPGTRLPSTRALASDLGVSRGTVVESYEQLVAEGYLVSQQGSGTVVAEAAAVGAQALLDDGPPERRVRYELRPGSPDLASFPRGVWVAAMRRVLARVPDEALGYGDRRGVLAARESIAAYLQRVRGARTTPGRILLTPGFTSALTSVVGLLVEKGTKRFAVEDPGGYEQRASVVVAGGEPVPIPVDSDGIVVDELARADVGAVLVTPAHQYPMGVALSPDRRAELVRWAQATDGIILEDDYDAEFRYDRSPVGTVQGLAPDQVVLMSSVAKILAPGIRAGWLVVPRRYVEDLTEARMYRNSIPAALDHLVLAELIDSGKYDRHLRATRRRYRRRRDALASSMAEYAPEIRVEGIAAGLHAVLALPEGVDEARVVEELADRSVAVSPLAPYGVRPLPPGLVVGYARAEADLVRRAARIIADVVADQTGV